MLYELIEYLKNVVKTDKIEYIGEDNEGFHFVVMENLYIYEYKLLKKMNADGSNLEKSPLGLKKWKCVATINLEQFLIFAK